MLHSIQYLFYMGYLSNYLGYEMNKNIIILSNQIMNKKCLEFQLKKIKSNQIKKKKILKIITLKA